MLAVDSVVWEVTLFPNACQAAFKEAMPSVLATTTKSGIDMKRIFTKTRVASGCVALALATGFSPLATARDGAHRLTRSDYQNIFLGEIETTNYSEVRSELGVVGEVELVRERYQDGKVKIERQVTLNGDGNYVNHGAWKQFSTTGDVVAEGQYNFGQRVGMWTRWVGRNDTAMLNEKPFKDFKAPFMSQANFADGKMDGEWTVTDANERKVLAITLKSGERNGTATIWLPNGKIFSQITYDLGVPVGDMMQANPKTGELVTGASYDHGRKVTTESDYYPAARGRQIKTPETRQMKSQVMYLAAKSVERSQDDFWTLKLAQYDTEGEDVRHGVAKYWYPNGQMEMEGFYTNDKKTGIFTYWHENGQAQCTGEYRDGQAEGTWVWWHQNGQKSAVGKYEHGSLIGEWRWWDDEGKLTKQQTYTGTESAAAEPEPVEEIDISQRSLLGTRQE
jgi:antitoxin component YwqK of YwqJK toxin-antitoxin module